MQEGFQFDWYELNYYKRHLNIIEDNGMGSTTRCKFARTTTFIRLGSKEKELLKSWSLEGKTIDCMTKLYNSNFDQRIR